MALDQDKPVYCMGRSIYNIEGLTQSLPTTPLDVFWRAPKAPNQPLYRAFKRILNAQALVHGNFYSAQGISLAVADSVRRFEDSHVHLQPKHRQMVMRSRDELSKYRKFGI